jgi:hypothetical protein
MSERLLPLRAEDAQQADGQPAVGNVSAWVVESPRSRCP